MTQPATTRGKRDAPRIRQFDPFDRFFGDRRPLHRMAKPPDTWAPSADMHDQDGSIVVKVELPGVKKEDIAVAVEDGDLVIRGERKTDSKVEEKDYYRMERSFGAFYRRFPLPNGLNAEQIEVAYADGELKVTVPRPAAAQPAKTTVTIT
jgi:HSP20 family protein